ncbi:hypothetical protein GDO81_003176 [Engystomops pustulosus]|uniref:Secreted protein n=1 Tax=Engystomops pustulosus TaxID=76066 RepID=A0AAV7A205_ENGPU|nr:hypothetical protein GDO81_003176 [Engystomops pustulosus]
MLWGRSLVCIHVCVGRGGYRLFGVTYYQLYTESRPPCSSDGFGQLLHLHGCVKSYSHCWDELAAAFSTNIHVRT